MLSFASEFKGTLAIESMLIKGVNDIELNISGLARFLKRGTNGKRTQTRNGRGWRLHLS